MDIDLDDYLQADELHDGRDIDNVAEHLFEDHDSDEQRDEDNQGVDTAADSRPADDVDVDVSGGGQTRKKRVIRPQPKLNVDRLLGTRGLAALRRSMSALPAAVAGGGGRGNERAELRALMVRLGHWCHRLFPSQPMDAVLERIEKIGKSKQMQVNIKKMRMGMEVCASQRTDATSDVTAGDDDVIRGDAAVDVFDELIARAPVTHSLSDAADISDGDEWPSAAARPATTTQQARDSSPQTALSQAPVNEQQAITAQQRDRINRNRQLAQLRRMRAKFASSNAPVSSDDTVAAVVASADPQTADDGDMAVNTAADELTEARAIDEVAALCSGDAVRDQQGVAALDECWQLEPQTKKSTRDETEEVPMPSKCVKLHEFY